MIPVWMKEGIHLNFGCLEMVLFLPQPRTGTTYFYRSLYEFSSPVMFNFLFHLVLHVWGFFLIVAERLLHYSAGPYSEVLRKWSLSKVLHLIVGVLL